MQTFGILVHFKKKMFCVAEVWKDVSLITWSMSYYGKGTETLKATPPGSHVARRSEQI